MTDPRQNQDQVAEILREICPAFLWAGNQGACVWHKSYCTAMPNRGYTNHCVCVHHLTASCPAGHWTALSFLEDGSAARMLHLAKQACTADSLKPEPEPEFQPGELVVSRGGCLYIVTRDGVTAPYESRSYANEDASLRAATVDDVAEFASGFRHNTFSAFKYLARLVASLEKK